MNGFFADMATNPFLLTGLLAGLCASVACGLVGPYVIERRIVFLSGAISHMAVGGLGAAIFLAAFAPDVFGGLTPLGGAMVVALLAAVLIGLVHERVHERMDTVIGAMWAIGMSIGILLIKLTPGYHVELMSYLFGNIVFVPPEQVWLMLGLDLVVVGAVLLFHKRLLAICLDEQHSRLQGISVLGTHLILLSLVALTVICLIHVVGLVLVLALLTLPAATAAHHARRLAPMQIIAVALSCVLTTVPRIAVYGTRIGPESAIVLAAGAVYLTSVVLRRRRVRPG